MRPTTASRPRSPAARAVRHRHQGQGRHDAGGQGRDRHAARQGDRHRSALRAVRDRDQPGQDRRGRGCRSRAAAPTPPRTSRSRRCATSVVPTTVGKPPAPRSRSRRSRPGRRTSTTSCSRACRSCSASCSASPSSCCSSRSVPWSCRSRRSCSTCCRSAPPTACSPWSSRTGTASRLLGFQSVGGITSWMPLFLFVILFGLSMDYHVFILSRIREAVDRGMTTDDAVATGSRARPAWSPALPP